MKEEFVRLGWKPASKMASTAVADEQRKGDVEKAKQQHKRNSTLDDGSAFVEMDPSERYGRVGKCACL